MKKAREYFEYIKYIKKAAKRLCSREYLAVVVCVPIAIIAILICVGALSSVGKDNQKAPENTDKHTEDVTERQTYPPSSPYSLEFQSLGDGTCLVSGIGAYRGSELIIPDKSPDGDKVIGIGSRAFESCENLRKVELNEGLIEILDSAFLSCYQLETVTIPSTVDKIGSMAFGYCTAMTKLLIGENVRTIESSAFSHCRSLVTVKVPDSVESLGENVFFACEGLRSVALSKYIEVVPARTFSGCVSLQDVELRGRVRIVDVDAFRDCKQLNNVSFSDSLELICERAFANCAVLTISYSGSTSMWRNQVYTERYWNEGIISLPVSCSDGTIEMK